MEDLEVNPLYKAFLTKFKREFEIACKMSYLIAIPQSSSLDNYTIDQHFANSHILMPSKLLKMHYNPMQVGNFEQIEIDNNKLICRQSVGGKRQFFNQTASAPAAAGPSLVVAKILAEEIGYNVFSKEYKTIIIDKPLVPINRVNNGTNGVSGGGGGGGPMLSFRTILAPLSPRSQIIAQMAKQQRAQLINCRILANHDDCAKYLECISQELTLCLENDIKRMQNNYIILSPYLDDAARRARGTIESYISKYELTVANSQSSQSQSLDWICDSIYKSIRLSVENYVIHLLHGKLLPAIHKCYDKEDAKLLTKFNLILRCNLSLCQLGAQVAFSDFNLSDELTRTLKRFPNLQSPLAMVSCLLKAIDLISANLNQSVEFKRLLGAASPATRTTTTTTAAPATSLSSYWAPTPICSDDLIACLVYCLPRIKPNNLYSAIRYLEIFGWSSVDKDQASYYLATLESSIEYILKFNDAAETMNEKY